MIDIKFINDYINNIIDYQQWSYQLINNAVLNQIQNCVNILHNFMKP